MHIDLQYSVEVKNIMDIFAPLSLFLFFSEINLTSSKVKQTLLWYQMSISIDKH